MTYPKLCSVMCGKREGVWGKRAVCGGNARHAGEKDTFLQSRARSSSVPISLCACAQACNDPAPPFLANNRGDEVPATHSTGAAGRQGSGRQPSERSPSPLPSRPSYYARVRGGGGARERGSEGERKRKEREEEKNKNEKESMCVRAWIYMVNERRRVRGR